MSIDETIDQIEAARTSNNVNWMALVRLAFRVAPKEAREIMRQIGEHDAAIKRLVDKLGQEGA
jgi:hypothetical protein